MNRKLKKVMTQLLPVLCIPYEITICAAGSAWRSIAWLPTQMRYMSFFFVGLKNNLYICGRKKLNIDERL